VKVTFSSKLAKNKAIAAEADFWTMIAIDEYTNADIPNKMFLWGVVYEGIDGVLHTEHSGTQEFFTIIKKACEWALDLITFGDSSPKLCFEKLIIFVM